MAALEDVSLDALLDDLTQFPTGYLEDFNLPEWGNEDMSVVGYGDDFGGLAPAKNSLFENNSIFGVYSQAKEVKADKKKQQGPSAGEKQNTGTVTCKQCGLVPADVHCKGCAKELCTYCDFQAHAAASAKYAHHGQRSILQLGSGWANGAKLPKGGNGKGAKKEAPPLPKGTPPAATYTPATTTSMGLDQTILEFFKTKEFASAVSAVEQTSNWQTKSADFECADRAFGTTDQQGHAVGLPFYDDAEAEALQAMGQPAMAPAKKPPAPLGRAAPKHQRLAAASPRPALGSTSAPYVFQLAPSAKRFEMSPQQFAAWRALRKAALGRWRKKKLDQRLNPKVRYRSRKKIADNRPRVKGRFIKTEALVTAN